MITKFYQNIVLKNPKSVLIFLIIALFTFGYYSKDFKLDASSDTLILENDEDLKKYQEITDIYSTNEFLITTITSQQKIIKDENIRKVAKKVGSGANEVKPLPPEGLAFPRNSIIDGFNFSIIAHR